MKRNICVSAVSLLILQGISAQDGLIGNAVRNLPLLAPAGTEIHYQGSIDKTGGNADWDWYLYEDANREWVVLDVDGPGCIQNLTQHRYLTCSDPLFRFYLDGSKVAQYEVRLSEIGLKFPFCKPLADSYIGPYDNGRGPIRVARSFVPLPFNKSCKVTTDVRLYGNDRMRGESGWGHIVYHTFASPQSDTLAAYTENLENIRQLKSHGFSVPVTLPSDTTVIRRTELRPGEACLLASMDRSGVLSAVRLFADRIDAEAMQTVWMEITFDGHDTPDVLCPIGAFFGNSLAYNSVEYLLMGVTEGGMMYNTFPMPFWQGVTLRLHNRGTVTFGLAGGTVVHRTNNYPYEASGYFRNTPYYIRRHVEGEDCRVAHADGCGKMVAAHVTCWAERPNVISCEGDVHVYIDDEQTPRVQSDGSESYVSYGWGFPTPPEAHPFGGYDGLPDNPWSMTRLCIFDCYPFNSNISFNIESGEYNNQYLEHAGTIFYYGKDHVREALTDSIVVADGSSRRAHKCRIKGTHRIATATSVYEGTYNRRQLTHSFMSYGEGAEISFRVSINPANAGVRLLRMSNQRQPRQLAEVYVDGVRVVERNWYHADGNPHMQWLDDSFVIPERYTTGKSSISICIVPKSVGGNVAWTDVAYRVYSFDSREGR